MSVRTGAEKTAGRATEPVAPLAPRTLTVGLRVAGIMTRPAAQEDEDEDEEEVVATRV